MIPPTPMSIRQIMGELENRLIRIPDFQRELVWTPNQVETLLDSIYKGYPLGSFLMWHTTENLQEKNPLNFPVRRDAVDKKYLLDGQQRAVVMYGIFRNNLKLSKGRTKVEYRAYFDFSTQTFNLYKKRDIGAQKVRLSITQVPLDELVIIDTERGSTDKSALLRGIERRLIRTMRRLS